MVVMAISSLGEGTQCAVPVDVLVLNLAAETDHFAYAQEITGVAADGVDSDPRLRGLDGGRGKLSCGMTQVRGVASLPSQ